MMKNIPTEVKISIFIGLYAIVAISLYWIMWFLFPDMVRIVKSHDTFYPWYVMFEESFILADLWIVIASAIGVSGLMKMRPYGFLFLNLAASSAIFLGLMDLNFNIRSHMIREMSTNAVIEMVNILFCLTLAPIAIFMLWKKKELFLSEK